MNLNAPPMSHFVRDGLKLAFFDEGDPNGPPVLLIHGFASTAIANWVNPGWLKTLGEAGYRVIAIDNRGHGLSDKLYDADVYHPWIMAEDAVALLDHLGIPETHVMGYSMGARVSTFMAIAYPDRVRSLVLGGLGIGMVEGVGDWDPIADALVAPSLDDVSHARGRMFRAFAEQTKSDRQALAACIQGSRDLASREDVAKIEAPTLIAVGTKDDIAGSGQELAALMPNAEAIDIPNRDHMLAVGDKIFKTAVLEFYQRLDRR
ncbi:MULTISPECIES: alpha/beta hydrolase [unclassified Rhizobium]|jgi:pimeloyl-ACP methyl ester carboxylesterase|uniref:alpha/beta fold hydrolase n=1 Tax=unclassified Rhizobium TaxID=2613769 RepID=UPI0006460ED2|nr:MULTISPECIES: alpha/beta hydrolase [unclassified Rhizobium]MBN8952158.1 alpha/beta hydrolase [Rhizobium tropici]OJY77903.1 MAG: alpha/beta hydrolase [Rhizobium sp. 60-20]RKD56797.1 non-heme chloroperoxidase [Rhizobium sp. WW_1]